MADDDDEWLDREFINAWNRKLGGSYLYRVGDSVQIICPDIYQDDVYDLGDAGAIIAVDPYDAVPYQVQFYRTGRIAWIYPHEIWRTTDAKSPF